MKMPIWILRTLIKISCLYFLVLWRLRRGVWILARFTLNTKLMRLTFCPEKKMVSISDEAIGSCSSPLEDRRLGNQCPNEHV